MQFQNWLTWSILRALLSFPGEPSPEVSLLPELELVSVNFLLPISIYFDNESALYDLYQSTDRLILTDKLLITNFIETWKLKMNLRSSLFRILCVNETNHGWCFGSELRRRAQMKWKKVIQGAA